MTKNFQIYQLGDIEIWNIVTDYENKIWFDMFFLILKIGLYMDFQELNLLQTWFNKFSISTNFKYRNTCKWQAKHFEKSWNKPLRWYHFDQIIST